MQHDYHDLIKLFNRTFLDSLNTELLLGGDEPIYLPANEEREHHQIIFARGYFASAMHELAHWCIAGPERRLLEDYGYWYEPDGRTEQIQAEFEKVEVKPQAVEWILSASCGFPFQVSCDNLSGSFEPDRVAFTLKVREQVDAYLQYGMPERAKILSDTFRVFYNVAPLTLADFPEPKRLEEYV
ncbi:elongation factor P hydroxylase [Photobacterium damselae]|uniref:elongation factor P hydroxylase n=1 Tax=Photobacterium damselae TaxID=38293 RepID=UPI001F1C0C34|nr:elongation factor P hydroxylase [Photobacterium damselae]UKA02515.1 elongation factor P hydroxylase [Photobacterium damselae subsp. damselae]